MSRIKLLLFALPALVLWLADLSLTASSISDKAVDQAVAYAHRGVDAVSVRLAGRRAELQGLALRLGSSPGAFVTTDALRVGKSELAAAFRYMRARWTALMRCFDDGRLALDNNPAERALRCVAIGRKNYLFAGSDAGGRRAAAMYSMIESAKLNGLNPQHYLADVLTRIADHPARRIDELLPWNWQPIGAARAAA